MHVVLGSGAVVKDWAPTGGLDFCDFADCCCEFRGSCSFESMPDFAWILAAFANGSDPRFSCVSVLLPCK